MNFLFLSDTPLFRGTKPEEIESMLYCLNAKKRKYEKGSIILSVGDNINDVGLVLSGGVSIEIDDRWGNKTILDQIEPGRVFAETYASVPGETLMVNVVATTFTEILFLDMGKIVQNCSHACGHHVKVIRNLLTISSQKNLNLLRRSIHTSSKSIRGRLLSYLSFQEIRQGTHDFYISFNRQQLADYLNVDRSALSGELSKMQKEGLLTFEKNHFILSDQDIDMYI